ncbi:MAG: SHOCT domain-containing protein [Synergistetes bacterium]|nr:MAG: Uncharacterized protein XD52_0052 [bacterium 42_11]MBC7331062.1 SHOCT domain-containing protein [Synergistota bacterium]MDK2871818.1 putative rane protein [bacterium]
MFMMIIFLILIVMGILWFFRFGEIAIRKTTKSKALETLAERYAKGEIDDEEYERRKKKILEDI